jgi:SAM-dependent methyltransferase
MTPFYAHDSAGRIPDCFQFWPDPQSVLRRIRELLAPGGRLLFVVHSHGEHVPDWIPNPVTRSGRELDGLRAALTHAGCHITADETLRTGSQGIAARCA